MFNEEKDIITEDQEKITMEIVFNDCSDDERYVLQELNPDKILQHILKYFRPEVKGFIFRFDKVDIEGLLLLKNLNEWWRLSSIFCYELCLRYDISVLGGQTKISITYQKNEHK